MPITTRTPTEFQHWFKQRKNQQSHNNYSRLPPTLRFHFIQYSLVLILSRLMLQHFLSKTELAYVQRTKEFTKAQQRCIRYRLNKKLRLLGVNGESMSEFRDTTRQNYRDGADNLLPLGRWSSLVRIPPPDVIVVTEREKIWWAGGESNSRSPPCQGGIITRLDHRPYIHTKKIWCPNICCRSSFHGTTLFTIVSIRRKMAPIKIY